ncbi:MAG: YhcH/YjgK/YiaL family protein [Alistipes sp.]|nr:YhcH/YjgK/YiaL family protein [Alistipes sp.]
MILDHIDKVGLYKHLHPLFEEAFRFLLTTDLAALPPGKYPIAGDGLLAILSRENLRAVADAPLEAHDKYIDIQLVLEGEETYGWAPRQECTEPRGVMDTAKDILFFDDPYTATYSIAAGCFSIFFPTDAHAPLIGNPGGRVAKCVLKVKV